MKQYFEFWKIFCWATPTFMQFCFEKDLIVKFVDFVMQKRSPMISNIKQEISQEWISLAIPPIV
jgi:hypothetical protein